MVACSYCWLKERLAGCEERERNRRGWEMDSSEEWYATYKGNGVGDCERGGVGGGVGGEKGIRGRRRGRTGKGQE